MGSIAFHEDRKPRVPVALGGIAPGQVVVRQGQAVMVLRVPREAEASLDEAKFIYPNQHGVQCGHKGVPIVNLKTGSMWWASPNDQVWETEGAELRFTTHRHGE